MSKNTLSDMPQYPVVRLVVYQLKCVPAHGSKAAFSVIVKNPPELPHNSTTDKSKLVGHYCSLPKQSEAI